MRFPINFQFLNTTRWSVQVASVFLLLLTGVLWAQTGTSNIRGTVSDAQGRLVTGASVTINDRQNGLTRSAKTNSQGEYQFQQLPPATYEIAVAAAGFAALKQDGVRLMVDTPVTLNLTLSVQGQSVTVEVAGTAPLVNTTDATLGHAFGTEKIENLPFEGRDPVGILSLQPGVVFIAPKNQVSELQDSRGGSVNGARSDQTNVTLDGVDNNDQLLGFAFQGAVRATLDSLQEFRVTTSNSNADAGRSSGAQVSLVTKSGTNSFHGSAYEYNRSNVGEANDWFNKKSQLDSGLPNIPPHLVRNTFGATAGGPLVKDRLFFFLAYEGQRTRENQQITRIVPSDDLRHGIVSYLCSATDPNCPASGIFTLQASDLAKLDPNCSTPVPGFPSGTCPLGPGPNTAVMDIFTNQYPEPNSDSVGDGLNYRGFTFSGAAPGKTDTYIAKIDFNVTRNGNHRVFVRGGLNNDHGPLAKESVSQTGDAGPEFPGLPTNLVGVNNSKGLTVGYTAVLSNTIINNFRYGFVRQGTGAAGLKTQHFVQFRGLDNPLGFDTSLSTKVPVQNFVDDVTWTRGKHNLQFGGNYRRIDNERLSDSTSYFTATTNVSWLDNAAIANTGSSLDPGAPQFASLGFPAVAESFSSSYDSPVAALTGLVTEVDANYNLTKTLKALPEGAFVPRHFRSNEFEVYGQDTWRVTPNFTLTFGARYTLLQPPYETTGTQVAPSVSLHDWFNKRGQAMLAGQTYAPEIQFDLSGQANGKRPYWDWDYKNIAPRIAFAWSPNSDSGMFHRLFGSAGKTSIRGGYGIYYDHFGQGITNSFDRQGSFGLTTAISNPAATQSVDSAARFSDLFTIPDVSAQTTSDCPVSPCSIVAPPPTGSFPVTPPTTAFAITWGLDDKLKTPYSHVIDFSITRELPRGFVIEASYVGRMAHRLLQEEDLAMPLDIVDPASKTDYFSAATQLAKAANAGTDINSLAPIPYWEHLFPGAAGNVGFGPPGGTPDLNNAGCAPGVDFNATNYTATQAMYDMYSCFTGNETTGLFFADLLCLPACAQLPGQPNGGQPFNFFDNQWSSLYAWRSVGNSNYHAAQFSLRHSMTHGLQFDLNYTFSKSIDVGSNAERINQFEGGGFASQIINAWSPKQLRAVSDFDTRHQINANWVYELPFGRGKAYGSGMGRVANAIVGGWQFSGLLRWSSGLPFTVGSGLGFWPTNWELTSSAVLTGARPKTGTYMKDGNPNVFKNRDTANEAFRFAYPGESGQRNSLRGPGIFGLDTGLAKSWKLAETQALKFSWEVFNATNSVRFDAASANLSKANSSSFGNFIQTLSQKRVMQFSMRYSF